MDAHVFTNEAHCPFVFAEHETKAGHPEADFSRRKCKMSFIFILVSCGGNTLLFLSTILKTTLHLHVHCQITLKWTHPETCDG